MIPAFALSVLAAALFGAFLAGARGFTVAEHVTTVPVLVFAAVAIGGVVRGSGPFAPVVAAVAALVVIVVQDATRFHGWEIGDEQLVLGSLFVVCTAVAHGLRRITARPEPGPGASF